MAVTMDFAGASGTQYRFFEPPEVQGPTRAGGLFAYVRRAEDGPVLLYVGETENLAANWKERWEEAVSKHGATHLLLRLGLSGRIRREDQADLIAGQRPVMNSPQEGASRSDADDGVSPSI